MIIKSVKIQDYRNLKDFYLEFSDGFNMIWGVNGSGKSAVYNAIVETILFDLSFYKKNYHKLSEPYIINLEVQVDDGILKITKDAKNSDFYMVVEGVRYNRENAYDKFVELTSISMNREVLRQLFMLDQREWIYNFEKSKNIKGLADVIKNNMAPENLKSDTDVIKRVRNHRKKLNKTIREMKERKEDIQKEIDDIRGFVIERETALNMLLKLRLEFREVQSALENKEFAYRAYSDYSSLQEEFTTLSDDIVALRERMEKIEKLEDKKIYIENKLEGYKNFSIERFEEISRISALLENKNQEILSNDYKNVVSNIIVYRNISFVVATFVTIISVAGVYWSINFLFGLILSGILGFVTYYFKMRAQEEKNTGQMEVQREFSREVQTLNNDLNRMLSIMGVSTVEEFKERFRSREDLVNNLGKIRNELDVIYEEKNQHDLEQEYFRLRSEKNILKKKLSGVTQDEKDREQEIELMGQQIDELKNKSEKLEKDINNLELIVQKNKYDCENLSQADEEIAYIDETILDLEKKVNVSNFVEEYMKKAHMELMDNANSILDITIDKYFIYLTAWEYHDVKVEFTEENHLNFEIFSKTLETFITHDMLSQSNYDQLMLAFRLALIELIDEEGKIPILMDDIFSYFDERRIKSTGVLFNNISAGRQVFYFSGDKEITEHFSDKGVLKIKKI